MIVAKKVEARKGIDHEGYRVVIMIMVNMAVSLSITSIYTFLGGRKLKFPPGWLGNI